MMDAIDDVGGDRDGNFVGHRYYDNEANEIWQEASSGDYVALDTILPLWHTELNKGEQP
jgi:hypothetical protein